MKAKYCFIIFPSLLIFTGILAQTESPHANENALTTQPTGRPDGDVAALRNPPEFPETTKRRALEAYGRLPLSFEPNRGLADPGVKFLSRGRGYTLLLSATEAVLTLGMPDDMTSEAVLRMRFIGANPRPEISALDKMPGRSNYFLGNDPKKWNIDIPNYARIAYHDIYPAVDLVYYGNQGQLEYDFMIAPGLRR